MQNRMGAMNDELLDEIEEEFNDEMNDEYAYEWEDEYTGGLIGELDEETELELAAELLEIQTEEELEFFLADMARKVGRGVSRFANSPTGRRAVDALKGVARRALPAVGGAAGAWAGSKLGGLAGGALGTLVGPEGTVAGRAVGSYAGGSLGRYAGNTLGRYAARLFEIDMEAMSPEDAEFEIARRVVRLSAATLKNAATETKKLQRAGRPISAPTANAVVKKSIKKAAMEIAPVARPSHIVRPQTAGSSPFPNSGRWVKRGSRIILYL